MMILAFEFSAAQRSVALARDGVILAETAERPQEIDVERAQKAKDRADQRLKSNDPKVDYTRAEDALHRAETRLNVAKEK